MSEGHGLIRPGSQSFLAASQYASATTPPFTRRATLAFGGDGFSQPGSGYEDICARISFTLPIQITRCRLRFRNCSLFANTTVSQSVDITGAWWGTPNVGSEAAWLGDFTGAPTQVFTGATANLGTADYVTSWFTPPASALPNALQALSFGYTVATDGQVSVAGNTGWSWHSATNVGCAAAAGNAAVPGVGTPVALSNPFDVRLEYEFVGNNQIGLYFGTSLTNGWPNLVNTALGAMGTDQMWPNLVGNRLAHCIINGGVGGGTLPNFTSTSQLAWTRFDLGPGVNSGVSCTPDYAVIDLGVNDLNQNLLSTFQTSIQTIIANLKAAGISRIYVCSVPPGFAGVAVQAGTLKTALSTGALGSVSVTGPVSSTTASPGPAENPGIPADWFTTLGQITIASVTVTNLSPNLTVASGGFPGVQVGWMISGTDIPTGTQVQSISGNTLVMTKNATATPAAESVIFGAFGTYFEHPASGIAEGPFLTTAASGTTTLALTMAGTLANAHAAGAPMFTLFEGLRQNINWWIRGGVPGTLATFDLASIAEAEGLPTIPGSLNAQVPFAQQNWRHYASNAVGGVHPQNASLYQRWAALVASGMVGL
jgi:hypothetical protein